MVKIINLFRCLFRHEWMLSSNRRFGICDRCGKKQQYIRYMEQWQDIKK